MDKRRYKGELAKRLPPFPKVNESVGPIRQLSQKKAVTEAIESGLRHELKKLPLLFDHYGIKDRGHLGLFLMVIALARDWVPGYQRMDDRAGPKRKWNDTERARLSIAIDDYIDQGKATSKRQQVTKLEAAEALFRTPCWARKAASPAALLKQAEKARPIAVRMEKELIQRARELTIGG